MVYVIISNLIVFTSKNILVHLVQFQASNRCITMIFGNNFQVTFHLLIIIIAGAEAKPGNGMFFKQIVL